MTGLEGVAGAAVLGAATDAAKTAANSSRAQRQDEQRALLEAAKNTEGFRVAAEIKGKKMAAKEAMGLIIMRPLAAIMGVSRQYFDSDFGADYADKIKDVPDENLQTPKASIAGPVFEGLGYSLDEPALKEMYLELLARASDDRQAATAHPSFVQIIRDLTSDEALYLRPYLSTANRMTPIVQYRRVFEPSGYHAVMQTNILDIKDAHGRPRVDSMLPTYVDNWIRLKLVTVTYDSNLSAPDAYDWEAMRPERALAEAQLQAIRTPEFEKLIAERGETGVRVEAQRGLMMATDFGAQFAKTVGMHARAPRVITTQPDPAS